MSKSKRSVNCCLKATIATKHNTVCEVPSSLSSTKRRTTPSRHSSFAIFLTTLILLLTHAFGGDMIGDSYEMSSSQTEVQDYSDSTTVNSDNTGNPAPNVPQPSAHETHSVLHVQRRQLLESELLIEIIGVPTQISAEGLDVFAQEFTNAYNDEIEQSCDVRDDKHLLRIVSSQILSSVIDAFGDEPRTISSTIDFTYLMKVNVDCDGFCTNRQGVELFASSTGVEGMTVLEPEFRLCLPELSSVLQRFNTQVQNNIDGIDSVTSLSELDDIPCRSQQRNDDSDFQLLLAVNGNMDQRTTDQIAMFEKAALETYNQVNALNPDICDPNSLVMTSVHAEFFDSDGGILDPLTEPTDIDDHQHGRKLFFSGLFVRLYFNGKCNGCPGDTCLLDDTSNAQCVLRRAKKKKRRTLLRGDSELPDSHSPRTNARTATDSISCLCPKESDSRLPTPGEYHNKLDEVIQILRDESGFNLVTSLIYVTTDTSAKDNCCKYPTGSFPPVSPNANIQSLVEGYLMHNSSPYGYPINCWDVSEVSDMSNAFADQDSFNEDISCWETSKVTSMKNMFKGASAFNSDIGTWDVTNVEDFSGMFENAFAFNGDLATWTVSSAATISGMFQSAANFNQNLCGWGLDNSLGEAVDVFKGSGCLTQVDPDIASGTPYCYNCIE